MSEHSHDPLTDETLRLVSSVQDWARRSFPTDPEHSAGDCQWCPLCQLVAMLKGERPEVTARVAEAGTAVIGAMRALLDAAAEGAANAAAKGDAAKGDAANGDAANGDAEYRAAHAARPAQRPRVQRINLSDEG